MIEFGTVGLLKYDTSQRNLFQLSGVGQIISSYWIAGVGDTVQGWESVIYSGALFGAEFVRHVWMRTHASKRTAPFTKVYRAKQERVILINISTIYIRKTLYQAS